MTSACGSTGAAGISVAGSTASLRVAWFDAVVLEEFAQLSFRQRAGEAVDQLPVLTSITVGTERIWNAAASSCSLSTSTFASSNAPW